MYFIDIHHILHIDISYYFIPTVIFGLGGSYYNFYMTANSYVGDLSNLQPETRIRRFTLAEASIVLGVVSSYYAGYLITKYLGDFYIFVFTTICSGLAFIYGIVRIKNIIPEKMSEEDNKSVKVNSHSYISEIRLSYKLLPKFLLRNLLG